jgi:lactoylglutathione lyase
MEKVELTDIAHIGIRVHDLERSLRFYAVLGFEKTMGPMGKERVVILMNRAAKIEINLIVNAPNGSTPNVLMDVPVKEPGITHIALACPDIALATKTLAAAGYPIKDGPVTFGTGASAVFVRDPDGVVIELHQRA